MPSFCASAVEVIATGYIAFRAVLDRAATEPLRTEIAWLGSELSQARDDEVALAHLRALVAEQPPELVLGPIGLLAERRKRDTVLVDEARYGMDVAFIVMLCLTSLTGMALLILREAPMTRVAG